MSTLEGQVALVTGASRGIGRAVAERLAAEGASVVLNDHPNAAEELEAVAAAIGGNGVRAEVAVADVSDAAAVQAAVSGALDRFGAIDIVVNNAGISATGPIDELTEDDWDRTLDVNLKGQWLVTRALVPGMRERRRGSIVNIASELGLAGEADLSPYVAAKAGVIGLTKALAKELAPHGVRVNCVAPGPTDTAILPDWERTPEYVAAIPLSRIGLPADIAAAVWFLASPASAWTTGQVLSPNGGVVM
jgi:NAD(P)-dependent dehydrogenase (short-subunit alcohol dehydrogenase family)